MKLLAPLTLALAVATLSAPAMAQFKNAEDAIKYRQSAMTVMGNHFGRLGAMANGKAPFDAKVAAENAAVVETMSKLPFVAFLPGTDTGKTNALPEVWSDAAGFKTASEKMQGEVVKLNAAAKTGDLDALKAAFGEAGKSCKACHDNYRKKP
jgi:cytochrome c556